MLAPTVLARKQGKPVVVVGGHYDIIYDNLPKPLGMSVRDKLRRSLIQFLLPQVDRYVTNSDYSAIQARKLPFLPRDRIVRIYHGLPDIAAGYPLAKTNTVLTVGTVGKYQIYQKGLAAFVRAASLLPELGFILVGDWQGAAVETLKNWNNQNVAYTGFVPTQDLYEAMGHARVYVQASYLEGFGLALAEAMLFQSVPVVTTGGSLPEVVGDTGLYVPYDDPPATAEAIREACACWPIMAPRARDRILSLFPLERRKAELLALLESIYQQRH